MLLSLRPIVSITDLEYWEFSVFPTTKFKLRICFVDWDESKDNPFTDPHFLLANHSCFPIPSLQNTLLIGFELISHMPLCSHTFQPNASQQLNTHINHQAEKYILCQVHILSQHCLSGVEEKRACDERERVRMYIHAYVYLPLSSWENSYCDFALAGIRRIWLDYTLSLACTF